MNTGLDEQGIRLLALHLLVQGHAIPTLRVLHFHPNAPGLWGHCQSIITPVQHVFKGLKKGLNQAASPSSNPIKFQGKSLESLEIPTLCSNI